MTAKSGSIRAGRYERQVGGHRAFIPAPLPPDPPIEIDPPLYAALSRADRALGRLDGSIHTLPHPDLFVAMYVRKEAVLSSQIEGTQSSLQDVLAAEAKMLAPGRSNDVDEVLNYIAAMNHGLEQLKQLPVATRLIRGIHERLLRNVRGHRLTPGELRRTQNWIGPRDSAIREATFVPPPPDVVPQAMADLERFLNTESDLPLLIRIGLAHAQFETIHPFLDGNGRVGRLLITFLLCQQKVLTKPVLYLSHFFKQHRQEYYDRLQAVRDKGDWEGWLHFFLRGVYEVSQQATETARRILSLREEHRDLITAELGRGAANGHRVLERLYRSPIITVAEVRKLLDVSNPTANDLVARFVEHGILQEQTGQKRNRRFAYQSYIDLFYTEGPDIDQP